MSESAYKKKFQASDLVLSVPTNPAVSQALLPWDPYLAALVRNRDYQAQAVRTAATFLLNANLPTTEALVAHNLEGPRAVALRTRLTGDEYNLAMPTLRHAVIDMATGTGKSFVAFGIAQVAMATGVADAVLVLVPNLTIKRELTAKFRSLAASQKLRAKLPPSAVPLDVTDPGQLPEVGQVLVENVHNIYRGSKSGLREALDEALRAGLKLLVISDEAHHIYGQTDDPIETGTQWKDFLTTAQISASIGLTGTAYVKDEYLYDVIFRYSLRQATTDGVVKRINYLKKNTCKNTEEHLQAIIQMHLENVDIFEGQLRPLTILVTSTIEEAKSLGETLAQELSWATQAPIEQSRRRVLIATSDAEHEDNVARLSLLDQGDSTDPADFVISVSMLSEGWDVKNVFLVVPWNAKAFKSKLLIAQVLGRGLRLPSLSTPSPEVRVYNHEVWGPAIDELVGELLEHEDRLVSTVVSGSHPRHPYHFDVHYLDRDLEPCAIPITPESRAPMTASTVVPLVAQPTNVTRSLVVVDLDGSSREQTIALRVPTKPRGDVIATVSELLQTRQWERALLPGADSGKDADVPVGFFDAVIERSMRAAGIESDGLSDQNTRAVMRAFRGLLTPPSTITQHKAVSAEVCIRSTESLRSSSTSLDAIAMGDVTVVHGVDWDSGDVSDGTRELLNLVVGEESTFPRAAGLSVPMARLRTPHEVVIVHSGPERDFVKRLTSASGAQAVSAWCKSTNSGFYTIPFDLVVNGRPFQRQFNPDFILSDVESTDRAGVTHVVVETKEDGDVSAENRAKLLAAEDYFTDLNQRLASAGTPVKYRFCMVSPDDYDAFFEYLADGRLAAGVFRSGLEAELRELKL